MDLVCFEHGYGWRHFCEYCLDEWIWFVLSMGMGGGISVNIVWISGYGVFNMGMDCISRY